jgi:hypothetical protein
MPGEREGSRVQAARWAGETLVIGNAFAFDMSKPTHWAPPLEEPKDGQ